MFTLQAWYDLMLKSVVYALLQFTLRVDKWRLNESTNLFRYFALREFS